MTPFKNADSITDPTLPAAMIDGIRRRLGKSTGGDPWNAEQDLKPETQEVGEPPTNTEVLLAASPAMGEFMPTDENTDFYKSLICTAIENGGRLGGHQIPIPWLRMILAGLEMRPIEPEVMWYGVEAERSGRNPAPAVPSYQDLFPGESVVAPRPDVA